VLLAGFLLGLFFYPEDGGDTFLGVVSQKIELHRVWRDTNNFSP
jgi:hypothetical protein